jgi:hypothetical protein
MPRSAVTASTPEIRAVAMFIWIESGDIRLVEVERRLTCAVARKDTYRFFRLTLASRGI